MKAFKKKSELVLIPIDRMAKGELGKGQKNRENERRIDQQEQQEKGRNSRKIKGGRNNPKGENQYLIPCQITMRKNNNERSLYLQA